MRPFSESATTSVRLPYSFVQPGKGRSSRSRCFVKNRNGFERKYFVAVTVRDNELHVDDNYELLAETVRGGEKTSGPLGSPTEWNGP